MRRSKVMTMIIFLLLAVVIDALGVQLQWEAPTKRSDGTPMTVGVQEYVIYLSDMAVPDDVSGLTPTMVIQANEAFPMPGTMIVTGDIDSACPGSTCHVRVAARDTQGQLGELSDPFVIALVRIEKLGVSVIVMPTQVSRSEDSP